MHDIKLTDECWLAAALLQRENPTRNSFRPKEIRQRIEREKLSSGMRSGIGAHLSQHMVANVKPVSGRYRMLYKTGEGAIRLFRQGDDFHPERKGKIRPQPEELPAKYRDLVRWYDEEYSPRNPQSDPVLAMSGAGKQMWRSVDADDYVNALRSNWEGLPEGR